MQGLCRWPCVAAILSLLVPQQQRAAADSVDPVDPIERLTQEVEFLKEARRKDRQLLLKLSVTSDKLTNDVHELQNGDVEDNFVNWRAELLLPLQHATSSEAKGHQRHSSNRKRAALLEVASPSSSPAPVEPPRLVDGPSPSSHTEQDELKHDEVYIVKSLEETHGLHKALPKAYIDDQRHQIEKLMNHTERLEQRVDRLNRQWTQWMDNVLKRLIAQEQQINLLKKELEERVPTVPPLDASSIGSGALFVGEDHSGEGSGVDVLTTDENVVHTVMTVDPKRLIKMVYHNQKHVEHRLKAAMETCRECPAQLEQIASDTARCRDDVARSEIEISQLKDLVAASDASHEQHVAALKDEANTLRISAGRTFSIANVIRQTQLDHFSMIQQFRQTLNEFETDLLRYAVKLNSMQTEFLNSSVSHCKQSNKDLQQDADLLEVRLSLSAVEKKFPDIYQHIKDMYKSLRGKADNSQLKEVIKDLLKCLNSIDTVVRLNSSFEAVKRAVRRMESQLPTDCSFNTPAKAKSYESGVYLINPVNSPSTIRVYCDIDDGDEGAGGWTVFQRRTSDVVSFKKTWDEYAAGFGNVSGDHWLGNEVIHLLTSQEDYVLRVEVTDVFDDVFFAEYDYFRLSDRADGYRLTVGDHRGNLSDALVEHRGMRFSAPDKDLDGSSTHCAKYYESGWWFTHCQKANLNGDFRIGIIWFDIGSADWIQLKRTVMKMRPMRTMRMTTSSSDISNTTDHHYSYHQ